MSRWKRYDFDAFRRLPREAGVYAIYLDGVLSYVGESINIQERFWMHNIRWGYACNIISPWGRDHKSVFVKVSVSARYGDWAMRELRLIRRLLPPFNRRGTAAMRRAAA